jgi:hypothetical protein
VAVQHRQRHAHARLGRRRPVEHHRAELERRPSTAYACASSSAVVTLASSGVGSGVGGPYDGDAAGASTATTCPPAVSTRAVPVTHTGGQPAARWGGCA